MLWGLYTLGFEREANDFFYFVADVCDGEEGELQIMYGVGGEEELPEEELEHLGGYEDARPVRIGNAAATQRQHDVWGAVLDSVYLHTKSRDYLPERVWPMLKRAVECAIANWSKPDQGIWEVRGPPRHFTSSKLMCWVACDRGARLAKLHGDRDLATTWRKAADEIHADICEHGVDERGVFVQHYETTALDASVLLMPLLRFLPPEDPRIRDTVLAIADELTVDELVLRYRVEETDDGFSGEEGTFTICSFWLVSALVEIGEVGPGPAAVREAAVLRQPAPAVRRGDRPPHRPPPRQLPPGVHPPGPDQRGHARDPGRGRRRRQPLPPPGRLPAVTRVEPVRSAPPDGRARWSCVCWSPPAALAGCAGSRQPGPPGSGPPVGEATSSSGTGAGGIHSPPARSRPGPRPPRPPATTRPAGGWRVGARPLPLRRDGFGKVLPTPAALRDRRLPTLDRLPPRPGGRFRSPVRPISRAVRARMGTTWKPGCPVGLADLRYVTVSFRGFDGGAHTGELVVQRRVAAVSSRCSQLYRARFPIEEMRLVTRADLEARPPATATTPPPSSAAPPQADPLVGPRRRPGRSTSTRSRTRTSAATWSCPSWPAPTWTVDDRRPG